ncbi:MAG: glycosyltransferase [Flavobacteriales bacterium]|nr:glycosyltransferase [Flavobacteriales bacterium]
MLKVLRIINRFNIGGPTYNAAYLTKYLSPEFKTVLVGGAIDEGEDSSEYILKQLGIKPIVIPEMQRSIQYNSDLIAYYKLKEIIQRFKPDIVHTHASKSGVLGRWAAYRCGVPVIIHTFHGHVFHSYFNRMKTELFKQVERKMAAVSTRIIALSDIQKYELSVKHQICEPEKISVIPLGFDLSRFQEQKESKRSSFRSKYNLAEDELAIGIIGRLVPIKNHELFIRSFANVKQQTQRKLRAFIIGDGERKEALIAFTKSLGLTVNIYPDKKPADVTFTSWIKEIDVANAGLDIICLTSLNEGTPVSLIEAQASGKPVVSTNVGGIENVVSAGKTGILVNQPNEILFSQALANLVSNDTMRLQFGAEGWGYVSKKFHYTRLVDDMRELYHDLLDVKAVKHASRYVSA